MAAPTLSEHTIAQLNKAIRCHLNMEQDLNTVYAAVNDQRYEGAIAPRLAAALLTSVQMQQALIVALVNALAEE